MASKKKRQLWIVVYIWRGIPDKVEIYRDQMKAEKREKLLRNRMDHQYDETGLYKINIGAGARFTGVRCWNPEIGEEENAI